jgi:hypothetical protein
LKPPVAPPRFDRRLAVVAAVGLLARILIVLWIPTQPVSDFWEYFTRATTLKASGSYDVSPSRPDAAHPPGYPLLLAFAMLLMPGVDPLLAAKLANCLLGAATIWIGARLAGEIGGDRAGFVAAILFAFYPRQLLMPCLLASENLFAPLLLLFALLTIRAARAATALPDALAAGVVVGALALTRTVAYGLGVVWAVASAAGRRKPGRIAAELLLLLLVQHAVLLPWALRNLRELGLLTFLTTTGGIGLFIGNNDNATGDWYPWQPDLERHRPGVFAGSAVEVDRAAREEAVEWIRANPGRAARLYLEKLRLIVVQDTLAADWAIFAEGISPPDPGVPVIRGPHPLKGHRRAALRFLRAAGVLLALFAFGGAFLLLRAAVRDGRPPMRAAFTALFATALYLPLVSAVIAVNGRYRWPLEDLAVPLAALLIARMMPTPRANRR